MIMSISRRILAQLPYQRMQVFWSARMQLRGYAASVAEGDVFSNSRQNVRKFWIEYSASKFIL